MNGGMPPVFTSIQITEFLGPTAVGVLGLLSAIAVIVLIRAAIRATRRAVRRQLVAAAIAAAGGSAAAWTALTNLLT